MSRQFAALRRTSLALGALWVCLGIAPSAQAADASAQRIAMACTQATDCQPAAQSATTRHSSEAATAKKAKAVSATTKAAVDYERDLWRHQSAS
jgi:hypothetical protein